MAKSPNTDADAPTAAPAEAPKPAAPAPPAPTFKEGGLVNPTPVTSTKNDSTKNERVTLVKGDHKVTTSHPVEINNYRARGYEIQK